MPLNPDKNLYSVAPIGNIVVIGRQTALKGGLTREQAINLLSGLILSTAATPDEIGASIMDMCTTGFQVKREPPKLVPAPPPEVFLGEIDAEEQAAIDAATKPEVATQPVAATQPPQMPTLPKYQPPVGREVMRPTAPQLPKPQVKVLDVDATAMAWQGKGA